MIYELNLRNDTGLEIAVKQEKGKEREQVCFLLLYFIYFYFFLNEFQNTMHE